MTLKADIFQHLIKDTSEDAWRIIIKEALDITSKTLEVNNAPSVVSKRDREIGILDHFLSTSGWDLWHAFSNSVEHTSDSTNSMVE